MIPAVLLLAAVSARVELIDEVIEVPPGQRQSVGINLQQRAAILDCDYETLSGGPGVAVTLLAAGGRPLIALPNRPSGRFRAPASAPAAYLLVIDNRLNRRHAARVRLKAGLDFEDPSHAGAKTLPPARRAAVIGISLLFLAAVAVFAGRPLLRALLRGQDAG